MSFLTGLSITAIVAAIAAFFKQVRQVLSHISSLLLLQKTVTGSLTNPVSTYLKSQCRRLPSGLGTFVGIYASIDDSSLTSIVPFEVAPSTGIWRTPHGAFLINASGLNISLISLRRFSDPQALIKAAIEYQNSLSVAASEGEGNFYVIQHIGSAGDQAPQRGTRIPRPSSNNSTGPLTADSEDSTGQSSAWNLVNTTIDRSFMYDQSRYIKNRQGKDPMRGLFFDEGVHKMLDGLKNWFARRSWYEERGIPWRIGVLSHGPGGTGKSSLARVSAQILGVPLNQFYLNTMTDREFMNFWDGMATPCVVAFEDFDTVFHGREPVTVHKSLSFECVLNKISGISSMNGVVLMVNTNHIEHIDPALGQLDSNGRPTRPGRIDYILELSYTSAEVRKNIAEFVLGSWADDLIAEVCAVGDESPFTAAQFQSLCVQKALERMNLNEK